MSNNFWDDEPYYKRETKPVEPPANVRYGIWNKRTFATAPRPSPLLEEYMAKKNICKDAE